MGCNLSDQTVVPVKPKVVDDVGNDTPDAPNTSDASDTSEDEQAPDLCLDVDCSNHGICSAASGSAMCNCEAGYEGEDCSTCSDSYRASGDDCVAMVFCDEASCGENGSCDDTSGAIACTCESEYAGDRCETCADGHFLSNGQCYRNIPCDEADPCGAYGTCEDSDQGVTCACDEGHDGARCDQCAATHYLVNESRCVLRASCDADSCNNRGTCSDATGVIDCTCTATYGGERCEGCYPGYVLIGSTCQIAQNCQPGSCFGNGTCDDDSGLVVCSCEFGYGQPNCQDCATGHTGAGCASCKAGYSMSSTGCTNICADGLLVAPELCDDGNTDPSNGTTDFCSSGCNFHNWPDGTWPGYMPPNVHGRWTNISINNNPSRYMRVAAGSSLSLKGHLNYDATTSGCNGCINQFYLGFISSDPDNNTDPLEGKHQRCDNFVGSTSRAIDSTFTAPTEPGTYYLRYRHDWDYDCNQGLRRPGIGNSLFVIHVD
ncbi:MAG: DUF4215 domain-containing protein [Bradymonadaceae bacterium]|nr:DUF4215 domain-containing protein [Lujinxingiaceae bacterium]